MSDYQELADAVRELKEIVYREIIEPPCLFILKIIFGSLLTG